jgi:hypothetical protein
VAKKVIELQWPLLGVDRSKPYRKQPPFSSPDCRNVRPTDTIEGRSRGGQRPGITKWSYDQLGSGNKVNLLDRVTAIKQDGYSIWSDGFDGTSLGAEWTAIGTAPSVVEDAYAYVDAGSSVGAYRTALSNLDTTQIYRVAIYIVPYAGEFAGDYIIYSHGANAGPTFTSNGFVATLSLTAAGAYSGTLKRYSGGSLTNTYTFSTGSSTLDPGWMEVVITTSGTANIKVKWQGTQLLNQNITVPAAGGQRIGFGMNATVTGSRCLVDTFEARYFQTLTVMPVTNREIVMAASNGTLYYDAQGTMTAAGGSLTLASDRYLHSAQRAQTLVVADIADKYLSYTNFVTGSSTVDSASVPDWTATSLVAGDWCFVVTGAGTGATLGVYQIQTVAAGNLTLTANPGSATGVSGYFTRVPKVWTSSTNNLTALVAASGKGSVPSLCPLICMYRDRTVFAGSQDYPHLAYASRIADNTDWDYSASDTDPARAWYLGMSSQEGTVGHPITALIAANDDNLVFGCSDRIMVLRGDVTYQGQLDTVSSTAGVLGPSGRAWCIGPSGEIFALGKNGLSLIPPALNSATELSASTLPRELKNIDTNFNTVLLAYDLEAGGVHIWVTPNAGGQTPQHWFYAHKSGGGFWPFTVPTNHEAFSILSPDPTYGAAIWGSRNGYLRMFADNCDTDEGTAVTSYVFYGPIRTAGNDYNTGLLTEIIGVLASGSGSVTWAVYVGDTCEAACDATTSFATGTWSQTNLQFTVRPRARGGAFLVKLSNGASRSWSVDSMIASVVPAGKQRKF